MRPRRHAGLPRITPKLIDAKNYPRLSKWLSISGCYQDRDDKIKHVMGKEMTEALPQFNPPFSFRQSTRSPVSIAETLSQLETLFILQAREARFTNLVSARNRRDAQKQRPVSPRCSCLVRIHIHSITDLFIYPFIYSIMRSCIYAFMHSCIYSSIRFLHYFLSLFFPLFLYLFR